MALSRSLIVANGLAALVAAGSCVIGLADPALILPSGTDATSGVDLYARMYGARALPLSAVVLYLLAGRSRRGLVPVLTVAGLAQVADAAIGVSLHNPGMIAGGTVLAAIHLVSAARLAREQCGPRRA